MPRSVLVALAVTLETAMLVELVRCRPLLGVLAWAGYLWFSVTFAFLRGELDP